MKKLSCALLLPMAALMFGCSSSEPSRNDPPGDTPADGTLEVGADEGGGGGTDSIDEPGPVLEPDDSIPPPSGNKDVQQLSDMASQDPEVLAGAVAYFESAYDDQGKQIFLDHLNDGNAVVRRGAIYGVFTLFDPSDPRMLAAIQSGLDDDDAVVRRVALKTMALDSFPRESFLASTLRMAKHLDAEYEPDAQTRAQVARLVTRYTTSGQPALPALNAAVKSDPEYLVRVASLRAIYRIARSAEEALPPPIHALANDPDPRVRRAAANQLARYRAGAAPAIPQLIAALADREIPQRAADDPLLGKDEPVCLAAADALTQIGQPAVKPLLEATESEDRQMRLLSIRALGGMGAAAEEALPKLRALTKSADSGEATAAKAAIVRIDAALMPARAG